MQTNADAHQHLRFDLVLGKLLSFPDANLLRSPAMTD